MALSQVSIANQALGWLGANLITSIDDDSVEANLVKANWDPLRRAVLEAREWTFAVDRRILTPLVNEPPFGASNAFLIPSDALRILTVRNDAREDTSFNGLHWVREGDRILCDSDKIHVRYLKDVEDVLLFSPAFAQALAARLAWDLAVPLTESGNKEQTMARKYEYALREAAATDGMQGRTRKLRAKPWGRGAFGSSMGPYV